MSNFKVVNGKIVKKNPKAPGEATEFEIQDAFYQYAYDRENGWYEETVGVVSWQVGRYWNNGVLADHSEFVEGDSVVKAIYQVTWPTYRVHLEFNSMMRSYYIAATGPNIHYAASATSKIHNQIANYVSSNPIKYDAGTTQSFAYHTSMIERINNGRSLPNVRFHYEEIQLGKKLEAAKTNYDLDAKASSDEVLKTKRQTKVQAEIPTWKLTDPNFLLAKPAFNNNLAAVIKFFLNDPFFTIQQKQQVLLNTLLDGAYMCKPTNKAAVEATFELLKETDHPSGKGKKWADVLADTLPKAAADKARHLAAQLDKENAYDKKWPWRRSDPNKPRKAAALKEFAHNLTEPVNLRIHSDHKAGDPVLLDIKGKVDAVTSTDVISGNGWGCFTSKGSGTGSRTNDLLTAIKQAADGLERTLAQKEMDARYAAEASALAAVTSAGSGGARAHYKADSSVGVGSRADFKRHDSVERSAVVARGAAGLSATTAISIPVVTHEIPRQRLYYSPPSP